MKLTKKGMNVGTVLGVTVTIIVLAGVGVPIVLETITNQSYTGILGTIMDNVPIFMGIGALIVATFIFSKR